MRKSTTAVSMSIKSSLKCLLKLYYGRKKTLHVHPIVFSIFWRYFKVWAFNKLEFELGIPRYLTIVLCSCIEWDFIGNTDSHCQWGKKTYSLILRVICFIWHVEFYIKWHNYRFEGCYLRFLWLRYLPISVHLCKLDTWRLQWQILCNGH